MLRAASDGSRKFLSRRSWSAYIINRFAAILTTHILQFDFDPIDYIDAKAASSAAATTTRTAAAVSARHRHRNQMLPMMIFGVTAFGVFAVPMGFQMLAILSGKALLMAKMALLLASMNGLKRVFFCRLECGLRTNRTPYSTTTQ